MRERWHSRPRLHCTEARRAHEDQASEAGKRARKCVRFYAPGQRDLELATVMNIHTWTKAAATHLRQEETDNTFKTSNVGYHPRPGLRGFML